MKLIEQLLLNLIPPRLANVLILLIQHCTLSNKKLNMISMRLKKHVNRLKRSHASHLTTANSWLSYQYLSKMTNTIHSRTSVNKLLKNQSRIRTKVYMKILHQLLINNLHKNSMKSIKTSPSAKKKATMKRN